MPLRGLIGSSIYSAPSYVPTGILVPVFTNRSPQKEFPPLAASVGLKTTLDSRLWKAYQIGFGSLATHFA